MLVNKERRSEIVLWPLWPTSDPERSVEHFLNKFGERPPVRRRRSRFGRSLALAKVGRVETDLSNSSVLVCLSLS